MIVTALQIQEATKTAVFDEQIMDLAGTILTNRDSVSDEEMAKLLFLYSGSLSSLVATLVSQILLSETQMNEMISEINEFEKISNDVLGE